jgi:hypothetical protein
LTLLAKITPTALNPNFYLAYCQETKNGEPQRPPYWSRLILDLTTGQDNAYCVKPELQRSLLPLQRTENPEPGLDPTGQDNAYCVKLELQLGPLPRCKERRTRYCHDRNDFSPIMTPRTGDPYGSPVRPRWPYIQRYRFTKTVFMPSLFIVGDR